MAGFTGIGLIAAGFNCKWSVPHFPRIEGGGSTILGSISIFFSWIYVPFLSSLVLEQIPIFYNCFYLKKQ